MVAGQLGGDAEQLLPVGQLVLHDNEQLFQLDRDLDRLCQHDQESTLLLAGDQLGKRRLDDLGIVQKAMEVVQQQEGGAIAVGEGWQSPQRGQRIAAGAVVRRGVAPVDVVAWSPQPPSRIETLMNPSWRACSLT